MKAINQSKVGGHVQGVIEDTNIQNHLITFFIPNDYRKIPIIDRPEIETN